MELQSISVISKQFGISVRTLRYYEQIGLIGSTKKGDSAYRFYDADTVSRLQQIIILRKLRIPLRQIAEILQSENAAVAIEAFQENLSEVNDEITALSTIKSILETFITRLNQGGLTAIKLALPDDESLLEIVDSLTASKINFKEDKTMEELEKASETLGKLTDQDVRIVYLPPMTVASIFHMGINGDMSYLGSGEQQTCIDLHEFIRKNDLVKIKPDLRHIGFNRDRSEDEKNHGYERWVSIPEDMEVEPPFEKKRFPGRSAFRTSDRKGGKRVYTGQ